MPSRGYKYGYLLGMLIPLWLLVGVAISGYIYPNYSHLHQAMSELGAVGSATQFMSPLINNYPLGLLFIAFGIAVIKSFALSTLAKTSGVLIVVHGIASIAAGYFPCDAGCLPKQASLSQQLHNTAGLIMFLSLFIANALWLYLGHTLLASKGFIIFSLLCLITAIAMLPLMANAIATDQLFGLFQRINYAASACWLAGLAYTLKQQAFSAHTTHYE
ncbi:DUF998 domain-containing protein [Dasania marina]|uniref:DUF998 domain-containing protein n=1 Tax=Dasania marina TaxID=471499 RepID=UPI000373FC56|nr:DUF998 domain-containing protein [Dasania marina]